MFLSLYVGSKRAAQQHPGAETQISQGSEERQLGLRTEGDPTTAAEKGSKRGGKLLLIWSHFATCSIFLNVVSQEEAADKRLQKEVQVTLYRNYRVGDFPDIQISYSSLITPLQALAQVVML